MRLTRVRYIIKHPEGYANPDFIPMVCPGCGMTHGFTSMEFYAHLRKCEALKGKDVLLAENFNLKCVNRVTASAVTVNITCYRYNICFNNVTGIVLNNNLSIC